MNEVQEVYRLAGVNINDKHIGVIIRQMMRKVEILQVGDTNFIFGQQIDKHRFHEENRKVMREGGQPAVGRPLLLGITRASLNIDSWISAASFQETTRVLTNAAIAGNQDNLRGLKENVVIGHLIPAGTGIRAYKKMKLYDQNREDLDAHMQQILEQKEREKNLERELNKEREGVEAV
jgi:DNA-directed RNA polymerase subunit beta'